MKRFGFCLGFSVFFFLISTNLHAANLLARENFNDKTVHLPLYIEQGGPATWATGRDGTGYCIYFNLNADRDSVLMMKPSLGSSDEIYISYWMRYPDAKSTAPGIENMKFFYPHFVGNGYIAYALMNIDTGSTYYSAKDNNGTMLTTGKWIGINGACDGKWHHYEWYIKFSTGVHKFWFDGNLKINYTYGPGKWTNKFMYLAGPSIDASGTSYFSRQIDDYEVWDGMPTSTTSTSSTSSSSNNPPPPPSGIKVVN